MIQFFQRRKTQLAKDLYQNKVNLSVFSEATSHLPLNGLKNNALKCSWKDFQIKLEHQEPFEPSAKLVKY